ncbi:MAG: long-chain fatty acid--CoA ligase [Ectothiorhodospiraceae bacterium]|nr:long-chain fatty acid--CoA ligase [Ectothiorhodospiraceae bacterium]
MFDRHFAHWPNDLPKAIRFPRTSLGYNLQVSATRFPDKTAIIYYDSRITYAELKRQVDALSAWLQQECGVGKGDRVLLYMQNAPQFVIGYYGILGAGAVVVPVNPMNLRGELEHYLDDTGAGTALVSQELFDNIRPLLGTRGLEHVLLACYSDYLTEPTDLKLPDVVSAPRMEVNAEGVTLWQSIMASGAERPLTPVAVGPDDLALIPYTSGSTGKPKGCMHTHGSVMATAWGGSLWNVMLPDHTCLSTLPYFHVTGMQSSMNGPIAVGATMAIMSRWDRVTAAELIQRYRVTHWRNITTMVVDFISNPELGKYDISSLIAIGGGGAAVPAAVEKKLKDLTGLSYVEGYGMSETIAQTHVNPPQRPKAQCLGIPTFDTDARVLEPGTTKELGVGEVGEICMSGPQIMQGYWNNRKATEEVFVELDGKRFLRSGDLGYYDEEGYFFMVDRLKRMINASGFKVWPSEVESMLYAHPDIQEVCVIASPDEKRGETVKAVVVLRPEARGKVSEQEIMDWARGQMAAYKCPRKVAFVEKLPRSGTGKLLWRELQEAERHS